MLEGWPLPDTENPEDATFWKKTKEGKLAVEACAECGRFRFPPRPMCPWCNSQAIEWKDVSGKGRIWSFCVSHPPLIPVFAERAPYPVIIVELDEDPTIRMVGNLVTSPEGDINEVDVSKIEIGAPVSAVFHEMADDVTLVRWQLA